MSAILKDGMWKSIEVPGNDIFGVYYAEFEEEEPETGYGFFVPRCNASEIEHVKEIMRRAIGYIDSTGYGILHVCEAGGRKEIMPYGTEAFCGAFWAAGIAIGWDPDSGYPNN